MNELLIAPKEYWIACTIQEAQRYLFCLDLDGKTGWRFPTKKELEEIEMAIGVIAFGILLIAMDFGAKKRCIIFCLLGK